MPSKILKRFEFKHQRKIELWTWSSDKKGNKELNGVTLIDPVEHLITDIECKNKAQAKMLFSLISQTNDIDLYEQYGLMLET